MCQFTSVEIRPELEKNILNFGYRINFKYEGMLTHSFEKIYVVSKFILPTVNDLNFVSIDFNEKCNYLNADLSNGQYWKDYITELKTFGENIVPFIDFYKKQIASYNQMWYKILDEISLLLPNFPKTRQEKRGIITSLITGFIGLAYEEISSYLHNR